MNINITRIFLAIKITFYIKPVRSGVAAVDVVYEVKHSIQMNMAMLLSDQNPCRTFPFCHGFQTI